MVKFPTVNREALAAIPIGQSRVFADCRPETVSSYRHRIPQATFTQARACLVISPEHTIAVMIITRQA